MKSRNRHRERKAERDRKTNRKNNTNWPERQIDRKVEKTQRQADIKAERKV
jgi:hypothetical protein